MFTDYRAQAQIIPYYPGSPRRPACILPMHRVVALHNLPDTRSQHLDRQRVVDCDDITGICIWKSVRDDASHRD